MDITYKNISRLYLSKGNRGKNNFTDGKRTYYEKECKFCGKSYLTTELHSNFCSTAHGVSYQSLIEKFGRRYSIDTVEFIYNLHWIADLSILQISKEFGWQRASITSYMCNNLIPHRTISQDNKRRYKHMTDDEIKAQTKSANKKCRKDIKNGEWHLQGENHHNYKHGQSNSKWYRNRASAKRKAMKKNQTPELTEIEKNRILFIYEVCGTMADYHVDHIRPISKGGLHHPDNLQILSAELNLQKSDKYPLTDEEQVLYKGVTI